MIRYMANVRTQSRKCLVSTNSTSKSFVRPDRDRFLHMKFSSSASHSNLFLRVVLHIMCLEMHFSIEFIFTMLTDEFVFSFTYLEKVSNQVFVRIFAGEYVLASRTEVVARCPWSLYLMAGMTRRCSNTITCGDKRLQRLLLKQWTGTGCVRGLPTRGSWI